MADTAASTTAGTVTSQGLTAGFTHPAQTNDLTHVCTDPDQGRTTWLAADGSSFTSPASVSASTSASQTTLIKVPA